MSGYEEEVAERRRNDSNTAALCNEIVARCSTQPGADIHDALERVRGMLIARRDEALLTIRRLSFGDTVNTIVHCPACKKPNDVSFQLSSIPIDLKAAPERIEVEVPGGPVEMRLPTAGDQEELLSTKIQSESERRTWLLSHVITRFGSDTGPFDMDFARGLPVGTRRKLEEALEEVVPDLDLNMSLVCVECEYPFKSAFDVAAFFFAEMMLRARRMLRDVHRLAKVYHWGERQILELPIVRRLAYLRLIEAEEDAALFPGLDLEQ